MFDSAFKFAFSLVVVCMIIYCFLYFGKTLFFSIPEVNAQNIKIERVTKTVTNWDSIGLGVDVKKVVIAGSTCVIARAMGSVSISCQN